MALSYSLTYSRADRSQEKSCRIPATCNFFQLLGLAKTVFARSRAPSRAAGVYGPNLKPVPVPAASL